MALKSTVRKHPKHPTKYQGCVFDKELKRVVVTCGHIEGHNTEAGAKLCAVRLVRYA